MTNEKADETMQVLQPCEICGKTTPPAEDDKYDDLYSPARPGSKAEALGLKEERLCGRCACAQFIGSYWDGLPGAHHTPIEQYAIRGSRGDRIVYVKRDDLWHGGEYGGGNAKLRGAEIHLRALKEHGVNHVAVMDARTSRAGWGIADLCKYLDMQCTTFFGRKKGEYTSIPYERTSFEIVRDDNADELPFFQQQIRKAGGQVIAMPASRVYPMYYKARKYCEEHGIYLMPMGLQLQEALLSVAGEVSSMPAELMRGDLVMVVATGTMFSGLLLGMRHDTHIIGVYIGMTSGEMSGRETKSDPEEIVRRRIKGLLPAGYEAPPFDIKLADREYYDEDNYPCPFSCDKWYDRKAWRWLCEHIDELHDPITFWNIG